jgi:hypothetical protein
VTQGKIVLKTVGAFCLLVAIFLVGGSIYKLLAATEVTFPLVLVVLLFLILGILFLFIGLSATASTTVDDLLERISRLLPKPVTQSLQQQPRQSKRGVIFISYARADQLWLERLRSHLAPLARHGQYEIKTDQDIPPGTRWNEQIRIMMYEAKVSISLLSPEYLGSKYVKTVEIPIMMELLDKGRLKPTWVHLRRCETIPPEFGQLQAAHDIRLPIAELTTHDEQDAALIKIANRTLL